MNDILRGKKVGLFPMCADILHAGHILALQEAKKHCDCLIVALNTHPDGKNPVQTVFERYTQLCAVECVDKVIPYQGKKDLEIIASALNYQVRFLGDDYKDSEWDGRQQELKRGIEPHFISRAHKLSSTDVKNRVIQANDEKEKILTIVRVRFGVRAEKTYDYKYIGETPVRVGDTVIVETKFQGKTEVEVVEVFQIKESEAQFDYALAEKKESDTE